MLENVPGARTDIRAKVVDFNETGLRIHVSLLLQANHVVVIKGQVAGMIPSGRASARVVDCRALTGSGYTVGLTFEKPGDTKRHDETPAMHDHEILTLSPNGNFRLRNFDPSETVAAKELEKSKRRGVLELLYNARQGRPRQATVTIDELEHLLGCRREDLDFSLWYLKENALITTSENDRHAITAKGVDCVEAEETAARDKRLLAAGD